MKVYDRNGTIEDFNILKLKDLVERNIIGLRHVDRDTLVHKICDGLPDQVSTVEIEMLAAEIGAALMTQSYEYGIFSSNVTVESLHKRTINSFSKKIFALYGREINTENDEKLKDCKRGIISEEFYTLVKRHGAKIDEVIDYRKDFDLSYFGVKTLERSYLLKKDGKIFERPQDLFMRTALEIHQDSLEDAFETYKLMSEKYFIHATPTLMNSGLIHNTLSSCFLFDLKDKKENLMKTVSECTQALLGGGGIGINAHEINDGFIQVLKILESVSKYATAKNKARSGAITVYLEPWHKDVFDFVELRKNTGKEEMRTRDLFIGLWIPDIFMKRVFEDSTWTLFQPENVPDLSNLYGKEFEKRYQEYENSDVEKTVVSAHRLWRMIIDAQIETGCPFFLYKDTCNQFSNQKNAGIIKSSNLCAEIIQFSNENETAVCNLGSIGLPKYVVNGCFDFNLLKKNTKILTKNLDKVIDRSLYLSKEAEYSNKKHRPMGIGVQGFADVLFLLKIPYDSEAAREFNENIFETIYYASLEASMEMAKEKGPYSSFKGSPLSKGFFHFENYDTKPKLWDFESLRSEILKFGIRNSLLVAQMPTASTSQILGFSESTEPITSNLYARRTKAGTFQVVNKYLIDDLDFHGLWTQNMKNMILENDGSIQEIPGIPKEIKRIYKTAWEIKAKNLVDMSADRAPYIDQSQSFNVFMPNPTYTQMTSMHFYGYRKKLKTGMYYLRTKPINQAIKFTVDRAALKQNEKEPNSEKECMGCEA